MGRQTMTVERGEWEGREEEAPPSKRMFDDVMQGASARVRSTLSALKDGCDRIERMDGVINQANVARIVEEQTGRRLHQTVRNTAAYKAYVKQRAQEKAARNPAGRRSGRSGAAPVIEDLAVRAYVEALEAQNEHLRHQTLMLRKAVAKLTPFRADELVSVAVGEPPDAAKAPRLSEMVKAETVDDIREFLSDQHLRMFRMRIEDGEIVYLTERTLVKRSIVSLLQEIVAP